MNTKRRFLTALWVAGACAVLALTALNLIDFSKHSVSLATKPAASKVKPVAVPDEFDQTLAVIFRGGSTLELGTAIEFLDTITRIHRKLTSKQRAALLVTLGRGPSATMTIGSWSHLFNSACNALVAAPPAADEALLGLLEGVARNDSRQVMRLFALQHLGQHYAAASPTTQHRLRTLVLRLITDPSSKTAGTALTLWRDWEKSTGPADFSSFDLCRSIATDAGRPVDVRVTALHAIGDDSMVLGQARIIALDRSQPTILRKAALNLIGRHGVQQDLPALQQCSKESPRLAQASEPAARTLENRLAGIPQPVMKPY